MFIVTNCTCILVEFNLSRDWLDSQTRGLFKFIQELYFSQRNNITQHYYLS